MTTVSTRPLPGTVATQVPPPQAVDEARSLVSGGTSSADAVENLARSFDAEELRRARDWWVRRMPKQTWDDPSASAILQVIERALNQVDERVPPRRPPRTIAKHTF